MITDRTTPDTRKWSFDTLVRAQAFMKFIVEDMVSTYAPEADEHKKSLMAGDLILVEIDTAGVAINKWVGAEAIAA